MSSMVRCKRLKCTLKRPTKQSVFASSGLVCVISTFIISLFALVLTITFCIVGAMGKRTRYQQSPKAQLTVRVHGSSLTDDSQEYNKDPNAFPKDVMLVIILHLIG